MVEYERLPSLQGGADGLVVCNTTITRPQTLKSVNKCEVGGLSGKPLRDMATHTISDMYRLTKGKSDTVAERERKGERDE